jgi:hypothetical protein
MKRKDEKKRTIDQNKPARTNSTENLRFNRLNLKPSRKK